MITPEQQQAAQEFLKTSGYSAPAGSGAAGGASPKWYDAVQTEAMKNPPPQPGYGERVMDTLSESGQNVGKSFEQSATSISKDFGDYFSQDRGKNPVEGLLKAFVLLGHTAGSIGKTAIDIGANTAKSIVAPLSQVKGPGDARTIGQGAYEDLVKKPTEALAPHIKAAAESVKQAHPEMAPYLDNPDLMRSFGDVMNTLGLTGAGKLANAELPAAKEIASTLADTGKKAVLGVTGVPSKMAGSTMDWAKGVWSGGVAPQGAKEWMASSNVPGLRTSLEKQVGTSAQRLQEAAPLRGSGAAMQKPLVETYDDFVRQENKHILDVKQDPAISMIGERIGDAFDKVVKMRRSAGETMGEELKKIGHTKVETEGAFSNFQRDLLDNGASYDSVEKTLSAGPESKFATPDRNILGKYAYELQKLGADPTMKELDAFVSRMPKEIEGLKASQNITFHTNAERIISANLKDLREALVNAGTPTYKQSRTAYADLSQFIEEGGKHLGKITQSGDYAKDASIAKSAVQSVLNNGKKDWLIELENLTGYPALDESVLGLQAMKDLGDAKGESLLNLLEEGVHGPDTAGLPMKFLRGMAKGTGRAIKGNKVEQTRSYLLGLGKGKK